MDDFHSIEFGDYDDPLLMESTGVSPIDDNNIFVQCPDIYFPRPSASVPKAVILAPTMATALQGAGKDESSDASIEEKLSSSDKTALQSKMRDAEEQAVKGKLKVETLQVGKRKLDEQVQSALTEEGYGKQKAKKVKHTLYLI